MELGPLSRPAERAAPVLESDVCSTWLSSCRSRRAVLQQERQRYLARSEYGGLAGSWERRMPVTFRT